MHFLVAFCDSGLYLAECRSNDRTCGFLGARSVVARRAKPTKADVFDDICNPAVAKRVGAAAGLWAQRGSTLSKCRKNFIACVRSGRIFTDEFIGIGVV